MYVRFGSIYQQDGPGKILLSNCTWVVQTSVAIKDNTESVRAANDFFAGEMSYLRFIAQQKQSTNSMHVVALSAHAQSDVLVSILPILSILPCPALPCPVLPCPSPNSQALPMPKSHPIS